MVAARDLNTFFERAKERHQVPGISFAVLRNNRIVRQAQAGVVNLGTGVPVTPDAVFQIGSITKPLTATLVMQLVDEGLVETDAPLATYLPEFRVARRDVSQAVTIRQLLSHTSGIDGDFFIGSGRGDDAARRFIDKCAMVPSIFEPGEMMSYCNLGFAALGRLLEVIRRKPFDLVMQQYLFDPLGMQHAFAGPEQAIRFNCAIGHVPDGKKQGVWHPSKVPYLSFGQAAAGAVPTMSVTDLLQVARLHLNRGRAILDGTQLLSRSAVRAMQQRQIKLPRLTRNGIDAWGLGWFLMNWEGQRLYGHDGATIGQFAFMRVFPKKNLAFALLTNGGRAKLLFDEVCREVIKPLVGATQPLVPEPAERQPDLSRYLGCFQNMGVSVVLTDKRGTLQLNQTDRESGVDIYGKSIPLRFVDRDIARFVSDDPMLDGVLFHFTRPDETGRPRYLQSGFRKLKRVS